MSDNPRLGTLFDPNAEPPSRQEMTAAIQGARELLLITTRRALYATAAFLLSTASVVLVSDLGPLHAYWPSVGKYLLLLWMGLIIPFLVCVGWATNSWFCLQRLKKLKQ